MKLFGIPYDKFLYHLLCYVTNGLLCLGSYICYCLVKSSIDSKFLIGSQGYSNELAIFNIFIVSFFSTFLIYLIKNYKFHILFITVLQIILFGVVIQLYYTDRGLKLDGFFENLVVTVPYIIACSILIYTVQLFFGKKLLSSYYTQ